MADYPPPSDPTGGGSTPPPPPGGYGQPAYGQPAYGQPAYGPPGGSYGAAKTNVMAIISLVAAFVLCGISALVSVPLGIIALGQIKKSNGAESGKGLAIAGIIVSLVFTVGAWGLFLLSAVFVDEASDQIDDICEEFDSDGDGINDCEDTNTDFTATTFTIPN